MTSFLASELIVRFFFSRSGLSNIHTSGSSELSLRPTQAYQGKTIPFSHIYVSSNQYFDTITASLEQPQQLQTVSNQGQEFIRQHARFPRDLMSYDLHNVSDWHRCFAGKTALHIVLLNSFGSRQTDHQKGIIYLKRLSQLLAPVKVQFHIMHPLDADLAPLYEDLPNIFLYPDCLSVQQFFNADFYLDSTQISQLPLAETFDHISTETPKTAVIIPHFGSQDKLNLCLDALLTVTGFDPQWLYIVDNNEHNRYFTVGVNEGLQQAVGDDCDFFWILNNDTQPKPDYLQASLQRFTESPKAGIVGGKNLVTERPDRIFWGGSHQAFPTGVHKAGYVSRGSLNTATQESWATFSSVIIRQQTLQDCGLLDAKMRMIFSDSDYCFQAGLQGWQVWYEPEAVIFHDTGVSRSAPSEEIRAIFRQDKRAFYHKWSQLTGCQEPEELQGAIFRQIGFETAN